MQDLFDAFYGQCHLIIELPAFILFGIVLHFVIHFVIDLWNVIRSIVVRLSIVINTYEKAPLDDKTLWESDFRKLLNYNSWKIIEKRYRDGQGMVIICKHTDTNGKLFELSLNKEYQITHIRQIDNG